MTANMRANSQRGVLTKCGPLANRKTDENTAFSVSYGCVNKYLGDSSSRPQRMVLKIGQSSSHQSISISVAEISRETALELADSKYFEAAFNLADNRKSLRKACQQARQFYTEHAIQRNPFPPRNKFYFDPNRIKVKENENQADKETDTPRNTDSSLSLLEGSMSLTSVSSHNLLPVTPNISLKTPKKKKHHRFPSSKSAERHQPSYQPPKLLETPNLPQPSRPSKSVVEENRLMNTFYTSG